MQEILLETKNQIYETISLAAAFLKNFNLATLLLSIGLFYALFLRKWELKKILSFLLTVLLLFVLLVRAEALITATFGSENSQLSVGVARTVFAILVGMLLVFNMALKD